MDKEITFEAWMEQVNELLMSNASLNAWEFVETHDLRTWFDNDVPPEVTFENLYNDWMNQTDEDYM